MQNQLQRLSHLQSNAEIILQEIVSQVKGEMGPPPKRSSSSSKRQANCHSEYLTNSSVVKSLDNSNSNKFNSTKNYRIQKDVSNSNKTAKDLLVEEMMRRTKQMQMRQREASKALNSSDNRRKPFKQSMQYLDLPSATTYSQIQGHNIWNCDTEESLMIREEKDSEIQSQNTTHFAENEEAPYCPPSPSIAGGLKMFDEVSDFCNLKRREIKRLFKIEK
jgi:hypothetical protein